MAFTRYNPITGAVDAFVMKPNGAQARLALALSVSLSLHPCRTSIASGFELKKRIQEKAERGQERRGADPHRPTRAVP